jgi:alpha-tubulin suppressor-like RCC1 family protein
MDGSAPTTTAYPTAVPGTTLFVGNYTLRAQATKTGQTASAIPSASYTLTSAIGAGQVSGARNHSALVTPDGRVFTWGRGLNGRLGNGSNLVDVTTPKVVDGLTGVTAMSGQFWHNLALTMDGHVYGWGYNFDGQLGDGSQNDRFRPVPITSLTNIAAVSTGVYHSAVLTADGQVFTFGNNSNFRSLGVGDSITSSLVPIQVTGLPAITAITAGFYHTLALTADGHVFAWGSNLYGQIGIGTTDEFAPTPVQVPGLSDIVAVSAGSYFSTATARDGRVFVWGRNASDEWPLGIGGTSDVRSPVENPALSGSTVNAGYYGGFAQKPDGTLLGWGINGSGQVGTGDKTTLPGPVAVAAPPSALSYFFQDHSAILTPAGQLITFGSAAFGNLGDATTTDRATPTTIAFTAGANLFWAPPAPVFSVAPGTYANAVTLVVTSPMAGSTIRYTVDGSEPNESSLEVPATGEILINSTTTIRARVFAANRKPSAMTAGTYVIQP